MSRQNDLILRHITERGSITQVKAYRLYGIMRLASRINDLRKEGHDIKTEMIQVFNRDHEPVNVAKYVIGDRQMSLIGGGE